MTLSSFIFSHYFFAFLFVLLSYGVGRTLTRRLSYANLAEEIAFSSAVGVGTFGTALFFAGTLGLLTRVGVLAIAALGLAASASSWIAVGRRLLSAWRSRRRPAAREVLRLLLVLAICGLLLPLFLQPLYPPHLYDSVSYHLPVAKAFASEHRVGPTPNLRYCVFPSLQNILFSAMILVYDDISAQLVEWVSTLLIVCALVGWGMRRKTAATGVLAAAVWIGGPSVVVYSASAYIDVGLTLFCFLSMVAFFNWWESSESGWLVLSGAMSGFACGTKYSAGIIVALLGIAILVRAVEKRSWRVIFLFAVPCALIALPWYVRNYIYSANPMFPFLTSIFGNRGDCWTDQDHVNIAKEMARYGSPQTLVNFLRLPWDLSFHQEPFLKAAPYTKVFLVLPLVIAYCVARRRRLLELTMLIAFMTLWFVTSQVFRYLLPVFPLIAFLAAEMVVWVIDRLRIPAFLREIVVAVLIAAVSWPSIAYFPPVRKVLGPVPVTARERSLFLQRFPSYRCHEWMNRTYGRNYTIFIFAAPETTYFADGKPLGDVVGLTSYDRIDPTNAVGLFRTLRGHGAGFLMGTRAKYFPEARRSPFFDQHFKLVCACAQTEVWQLVDEPVTPRLGGERLKNTEFRDLGTDGSVRQWSVWGSPPGIGGNGLDLKPGSVVGQSLTLPAGRIFETRVIVDAVPETASVELRFDWLDAQGKVVASDRAPLPGEVEGNEFKAPMLVPSEAASVTFTLQNPGPVAVRILRVSMRELAYGAEPPSPAPARSTVAGVPVDLGQDHPHRGMSIEAANADAASITINEKSSIIEVLLPPIDPAKRFAFDFDISSEIGPFALRFFGPANIPSEPVYIDPRSVDDQDGWTRFTVTPSAQFQRELQRVRIDPPADVADGGFRLRKLRLRPLD